MPSSWRFSTSRFADEVKLTTVIWKLPSWESEQPSGVEDWGIGIGFARADAARARATNDFIFRSNRSIRAIERYVEDGCSGEEYIYDAKTTKA
jgi:hypothetical protein